MTGTEKGATKGWCPFLGFAQDPASIASFPSDVNRCWRTGSPHAVANQHQERYCLVSEYQDCSIFQDELAPAGAASDTSASSRRRWILIAAIFAIVVIISLFATGTIQSAFSGFAGLSGFLTRGSAAYVDQTEVVEDPLISAVSENTALPQTSTPTGVICKYPDDYVLYYLKAGDDINLIAAKYGLTVDQILSFNCLDDPDLITSGMSIAIPQNIPGKLTTTPTPERTSTLTPTLSATISMTPTSTATRTSTSTPFTPPTAPFLKKTRPPEVTEQPEPPIRP